MTSITRYSVKDLSGETLNKGGEIMKTKGQCVEIFEKKHISIAYYKAEKISELNICQHVNVKEINNLVNSVDRLLYMLDLRDGELNNDILLTQARRQVVKAKEKVCFTYYKIEDEQEILNNVIPLFPEYVGRIA